MSKIVILESLAVSDEKMRALKAPFEAQGHGLRSMRGLPIRRR